MAIFKKVKDFFNRAAASYAKAEDALSQYEDLPLDQAVGKLLREAEVVHLGDTDHRITKTLDWLAAPANLAKLRAQGVETLFIESHHRFQICAEGLAAGKITPRDFADFMLAQGCVRAYGDSEAGFLQVGQLVIDAAAAGIRVVFADLGLGREELWKLQEYCGKAGLGEDFIFQSKSREIDKRMKGKTPETIAEFTRLRDIWLKARCDDKPTVENMLAEKKGKAIVFYGAAHTFTGNFAALGVVARKIAVYPGFTDFGRAMRGKEKEALGDGAYLLDRETCCLWIKPAAPAKTPEPPKPPA
jgi:hypothetical protein